MGEWLYNFAAGSFHTKKLCSRLYSIEIEFLFKKQKIAFWAILGGGGLICNVHNPSIARWKVDFIFVKINLFCYQFFYVITGNLSKSAFFEGGWVTLSANFRRKGRWIPTTVVFRKLEWMPFRVASKNRQCIVEEKSPSLPCNVR